MWKEVEKATLKFAAADVRGREPKPGEHSDALLGELGLSAGEVATLREAGFVA